MTWCDGFVPFTLVHFQNDSRSRCVIAKTLCTILLSCILGRRLSPTERKLIDDACGEALAEMMSALRPSVVVAVGNFAGSKCAEVRRGFRRIVTLPGIYAAKIVEHLRNRCRARYSCWSAAWLVSFFLI